MSGFTFFLCLDCTSYFLLLGMVSFGYCKHMNTIKSEILQPWCRIGII
jgi:hypothetical protein